ncbi:MAG TPA: penicillin acylase family protein [Mycobacteriales bacterium]|nr:penicillin acylase family protein [Mycobacteriales bacterium]
MHRRLLAVAATASLLAAPAASAAVGRDARPAAGGYDTGGATLNILPPGSNGNVTAGDLVTLGVGNAPNLFDNPGDPKSALATATPTEPRNFADQLELYDALNTVAPYSLHTADLTKYFKDAAIGLPAHPVSTETPKPGVTIARDSFGVPHIVGQTAEDVAYGAGYAGIEDRMFLTDVLRHTGAAQMASFLGPTDSDIAMDQAQLQLAPYTPAEAEAQINSVVRRYGAEGRALLARLDAFIAGMNAAQEALCPGAFDANDAGGQAPGDNGAAFGPNCPVEYAALQKAPRPYTRADIVYIASLVGGIFGKGGGGEYQDALFYEALRAQFGSHRAKQMYDDLREKNDPEAFTTSSLRFPYLDGGVAPGRPSVALPVVGARTTPGTGAPATGDEPVAFEAPPVPGTAAYQRWQARLGHLRTPVGALDLSRHPTNESNALLVDAKHSADGHPVVVFGPQTGYYTPQLLTEVDLSGPGIKARGVSFAGTQFIVELGHGVDYAWSATSADGDNVDTVMERLCNPDGSPATTRSTHYIDNSSGRAECVPIDTFTHDESVVVPTAGGTGTPEVLSFTVMRTRHGVVQFRTLAHKGHHKVPVAVVTERSTYGHEADSAIGFARINNPDYTHDASDFEKAFAGVDYTFNWFYADDRDIAYKVSGLLPQRAAGVEPDFPRWGSAAYDWTGWLPQSHLPHQINPPAGFLTSWNNKQAPAFGVADDQWGQSGVHRVNLLAERIRRLFRHGPVTRAGLVGAMIDAATVDLRAEKLLPLALQVVGHDRRDRAAVRLLRGWVDDGAHRVDRKRTGHYQDQAAIALFDTWWDDNGSGRGGLAKASLRSGLGGLVDAIPYTTDDHPRKGLGSSWDSVAWYGYVSKALRQSLDRPVRGAFSRSYCGPLPTCRRHLRRSLHVAVQRALRAQGVASVQQLTYDKSIDDIAPVTAGIVGTRRLDWQNRPTFQQVVNFTSHRPR